MATAITEAMHAGNEQAFTAFMNLFNHLPLANVPASGQEAPQPQATSTTTTTNHATMYPPPAVCKGKNGNPCGNNDPNNWHHNVSHSEKHSGEVYWQCNNCNAWGAWVFKAPTTKPRFDFTGTQTQQKKANGYPSNKTEFQQAYRPLETGPVHHPPILTMPPATTVFTTAQPERKEEVKKETAEANDALAPEATFGVVVSNLIKIYQKCEQNGLILEDILQFVKEHRALMAEHDKDNKENRAPKRPDDDADDAPIKRTKIGIGLGV